MIRAKVKTGHFRTLLNDLFLIDFNTYFMKNLVYIASGTSVREYKKLEFDRINLVDKVHRSNSISRDGKIICLKMDAFEAFNYFKENEINIDCLVTLCESQGEGGFSYNMCSDVFMGYYMQILPPDFIWICNDSGYYMYLSKYRKNKPTYYPKPPTYWDDVRNREKYIKMSDFYGHNYVSLNLPYEMTELSEGMPGYIPPSTFSTLLDQKNEGYVFKMHYSPIVQEIIINDLLKIRLIQDSIWNHYDKLDAIYISFRLGFNEMKYYFENIPKVSYYKQLEFGQKLHESVELSHCHIGFTPHYYYQYDKVYQRLLVDFAHNFFQNNNGQPLTIDFYYLSSWFKTKHIKKAIKTIKCLLNKMGTDQITKNNQGL